MKTFFSVLRIASLAASLGAVLMGDMDWACWFLIYAVIFMLDERFHKEDDCEK